MNPMARTLAFFERVNKKTVMKLAMMRKSAARSPYFAAMSCCGLSTIGISGISAVSPATYSMRAIASTAWYSTSLTTVIL